MFLQKGMIVTLAIIPKSTLAPEKQRQMQRNFLKTFTARVQSFAKSGMNVAMNQKKNFCHIVGVATIDVIISKSQANKNIF